MFNEIDTALDDLAIDTEEKKEMEYIIAQSKKNIQAWKAHLRISWHIAVAITKNQSGQLKMLTFVHIFTSCTQDSYAVIPIIDDVVGQLKAERPELEKFFLRQDNAGCYHSTFNLLGMKEIAQKHKVKVRVDFSDPQGGKGSCDRKAATIKGHIKAYVNSGKDVESASQIESCNGVPGVRVMLCEPPQIPKLDPLKWEGVSYINDLCYNKDGVKVWREYGIGKGKTMKWSELDVPKKIPLPTINITANAASPKATFTEVSVRKSREASKSAEPTRVTEPDSSSSEDEDRTSKLFPCPDDGCIKSFQ